MTITRHLTPTAVKNKILTKMHFSPFRMSLSGKSHSFQQVLGVLECAGSGEGYVDLDTDPDITDQISVF